MLKKNNTNRKSQINIIKLLNNVDGSIYLADIDYLRKQPVTLELPDVFYYVMNN